MPLEVLENLIAWDGCDAVIHLGIIGRKHLLQGYIEAHRAAYPVVDTAFLAEVERLTEDLEIQFIRRVIGLMDAHRKPVVGVSLAKGSDDKTVVELDGKPFKGVFFAAPEQAVKSLSRMCRYREWRQREGLE
jgi:hypothetical protein